MTENQDTLEPTVLVVNGPNLNLLGEREPEIYGSESLADINEWIAGSFKGVDFVFYQSNHEGALIDFLQAYRHHNAVLVINPGALTHYSIALRDAIKGCQFRAVEVHLSAIHEREPFRQVSMVTDVCEAQIQGRGKQGYVDAVEFLLNATSA